MSMAKTGKDDIRRNLREDGHKKLSGREIKRYPEVQRHLEVSTGERIEARLKDASEKKRIFGLPRTEGFENSQLMKNEEVRDYLKNTFPERHVNNITMDCIKYHDQYVGVGNQIELGHWESRQPVKGLDVRDREIVINRQDSVGSMDKREMKDTIAHEVGHQVFRRYLENADRKAWHEISDKAGKGKYVSEYAAESYREDFAESYRYYIRHPEQLKEASSEKYGFMRDRVFGKREYTARDQVDKKKSQDKQVRNEVSDI